MGFNTVAFILNDRMHELEESPKTVAWALSHPPMYSEPPYMDRQVAFAAKEFGEIVPVGTLRVLPSFHASNRIFFMAGGNTIVDCKVLKKGKTKEGKKTVTLELPDWA